MKFHWTGQNHGAAVEFFMAVDGCIGVAFDEDKLLVRAGDKTWHIERDTTIDIEEASE